MAGTELAQVPAFLDRGTRDPLGDQFAEHAHEGAMRPNGAGTHHGETQLPAKLARFDVKVVEDLDVVGQEADRMDDDAGRLPLAQFSQVVKNIRLEPGVLRPAAPALINQGPFARLNSHLAGHQPARLLELELIAGGVGHRHRNTVRREDDMDQRASLGRDLGQPLPDPVRIGGNEIGMVVEGTRLLDPGAAGPTSSRACSISSRYWRQLE